MNSNIEKPALTDTQSKTAQLYRMVTDEHICPFGLRSKALLERNGYTVEDHELNSREDTDAFKEKHGVDTTPQTFIGGERIGGFDDLQAYFGVADPEDDDGTTYQPILAMFGTSALMALALQWWLGGLDQLFTIRTVEWFIAFSMCVLAIQKLQDLDGFINQFLPYDLLSQRWVRYAVVYPFAELFAGIGMIAGSLTPVVATVAIVIGLEGAASVIKAVYIDKRELKCACVGGDSNVPLGAISLTENVMMVLMGAWMLVKTYGL